MSDGTNRIRVIESSPIFRDRNRNVTRVRNGFYGFSTFNAIIAFISLTMICVMVSNGENGKDEQDIMSKLTIVFIGSLMVAMASCFGGCFISCGYHIDSGISTLSEGLLNVFCLIKDSCNPNSYLRIERDLESVGNERLEISELTPNIAETSFNTAADSSNSGESEELPSTYENIYPAHEEGENILISTLNSNPITIDSSNGHEYGITPPAYELVSMISPSNAPTAVMSNTHLSSTREEGDHVSRPDSNSRCIIS